MPPPDLIVLPESPFTQLFDTNHAATSFERAQIIGLIERPMARLKELNNEIMRIKKVAEFLVAERSTVHRYIRSHQALLSPMRGLPAEILSEIFLHCLPLDRNPVRSMREPPLLFTRVCRRWRDVALNTPRLWTRIHIFIPQVHTLPRAEQKRIFEMRALGWETWLKRSGALPVSISLHVNWDDNPMPVLISNPSGGGGGTLGLAGGFAAADFTLLADFAQLLMTFSRRWRNLTLHIPLAILQLLAYTLSADDVPALEQIKLSYRPPLEILSITPLPEERKFSLSQLRLLETPSLRSLSLVSHLESPYSMQLQWSNLTDLDLQSQFFRGSIKLTECFGILDKACKLQRCAVTVGLSSPLEFVPSSLDASGALVLQPPEPNDLSLSHLLLELSLGKTIHLPATSASE
ncbi:hypothetical protein GYMLUDRAFT_877971 [Collybiopsis luxurians FD-317 M1]|nr:hypothetical protein GYMLUDRAFT_877971 [Collybiopsis luxurians FD-317 M1]